MWRLSLLPLFISAGCNIPICVEGQESYNLFPKVSLTWSWDFHFNYQSNDTETPFVYTFHPKSSGFEVKDTGENDTFLLEITPSLTGSSLSHCVLTIVISKSEGYFAWTNMTLDYKFNDAITKNATLSNTSAVLLTKQIARSSPHEKFLTNVNDVYECLSRIPIPLENNVVITFEQMKFQAFNAIPDPVNKSTEVCPRDFKTNIPIAALTGSSLLVIITIIVGAFGIKLFLNRRKHKQS